MRDTKAASMTSGTEWKLILMFTLPLMAGNLLQQLYNTVDGIIVGNFVSENALASVGTCSSLTMLFIALALGMSNGAAVIIAQFFGANKMEQLRKTVATALILFVVMGVVFSVVALLLASWLLTVILNVQDYLLAGAVLYFRIYALGLLFQFLYNIVAAILRSLGDSRATLYFLLISSVCNILLDLLFTLVLRWGIAGVAIATVISQGLSALVSLIYMFRLYPMLRFEKGEFTFDRQTCGLIVKMGIPTTLQQCVVSFGHMAIQRVINSFDITAGYTAAARIESFAIIPAQGFLMGVTTFTGQNLGAGKLDRISRGLRQTLLMSFVVDILVIAIILPLAPTLVGLFGVVGSSAAIAVQYLRFCSCALAVFCTYFCFNGVLQGAGDVGFTAFNTFTGLVMKVVFVYLMAYLTPLGVSAVWYCNLVSWLYSLALSALRYRFGPWRKKGVVA